jgi:MFS family permease
LFFIDNGISFTQIGLLYAAREIVTNISEIPSGIVADTYGRKSALLSAFLLYIFSFIVFYFSENFNFLLGAMVLMGIGDAFRSGTHKGMIMDYLRINQWNEFKVQYYGETRSWSQIGSAISALLAGIMVFYSGNYRVIYLISIFPYLLNFINIYLYPEELNHSIKREKTSHFSINGVLKSILLSLREKRVLQIVNSSALHSAYLKSVKDYIQPLLLNLAIFLPIGIGLDSKSRSGLIIGIAYFIIYLFTSSASKNSTRLLSLGIHKIEQKTLIAGLTLGMMSGIFYLYNVWWISTFFFVLIYIVENLRKPILTGFLADSVPNEILTSVISTQSFYSTIATAIIAILIGTLAEHYGIGISLVVVSLSLILLTFVIDFGIRRNTTH